MGIMKQTYHCLFCGKEGTKKEIGVVELDFYSTEFDEHDRYVACYNCSEILKDMVRKLRGAWENG